MIVLGLTGSIGMGKSKAASMLKRLGVPVHDSDRAVHKALHKGKAFEAVAKLFPSTLIDGRIDRKTLGGIVFKDKAALKKLESILHPAAKDSQKKFVKSMQRLGKRAVALDIPLLFETGAEERVDYVICVTAPYAIQRRRVLARSNMNEEKFKSILASQMQDRKKRDLSDFVVQTGMGQALTYSQLRKILKTVGV
jgi:dephospho-CoA kinase